MHLMNMYVYRNRIHTALFDIYCCSFHASCLLIRRVTTCLEMSGNLTAVREMSGILPKVREMSIERKSCQGKVT